VFNFSKKKVSFINLLNEKNGEGIKAMLGTHYNKPTEHNYMCTQKYKAKTCNVCTTISHNSY
jgi:hypothetical protein